MGKIKDWSIKKTLAFYLSIAFVCSLLLTLLITGIFEDIQADIFRKHTDMDKLAEITEYISSTYGYSIITPRISTAELSFSERFVVEACDFVVSWNTFIIYICFSGIAIHLFYKHKLKTPLKVLQSGSEMIAANSLDFTIEYSCSDEMGLLCKAFERMRSELLINNKQLWNMIDEQKRLRSVVAHDIRTPLSVIKGYNEMLLEFIPESKLSNVQITEMLTASTVQVERLEGFSDNMKELSSIEQRAVSYDTVSLQELLGQLENTTKILSAESEKDVEINSDFGLVSSVKADKYIVLEVAENLLSNAMRYARSSVTLSATMINSTLQITVSDDGAGFGKDIKQLTRPYYCGEQADKGKHLGLGLYICELLCGKHNGSLILSNNEDSGACAVASFKVSIE